MPRYSGGTRGGTKLVPKFSHHFPEQTTKDGMGPALARDTIGLLDISLTYCHFILYATRHEITMSSHASLTQCVNTRISTTKVLLIVPILSLESVPPYFGTVQLHLQILQLYRCTSTAVVLSSLVKCRFEGPIRSS